MPFPRLLLIAAVVPAAAPADGIAPPALGAAAALPPAISRGFAGAYIGGLIGAGRLDADAVFEGLGDAVGEAFGAGEAAAGLSDGPDTGVAYSLHAGFNVQRDRFVFGPELAVFGVEAEPTGAVFGTFPVVVSPNEVSAQLDRGARLAARGGVVVGATLIYGTAGVAYLEGEAPALDGIDGLSASVRGEEFGEWGYAVGFGVERLLGPSLVVGAQYTLHRVPEVGDLDADLSHRMLEARVSVRF